MVRKATVSQDFEALLDRTTGERTVTGFLRQHPEILYWTLCPSAGHARYVLPSFPIGPDFRTDFAVVNAYSGAVKVFFVELEPVDVPRFTRAGNPAKRLAAAIKQLDDWREYFKSHPDTVRASLVRWAQTKDVLKHNGRARIPGNFSGQRLSESRTPLLDGYKVIIGRSGSESHEVRRLAGRFEQAHAIEVISYDRLLGTAKRRETHPQSR